MQHPNDFREVDPKQDHYEYWAVPVPVRKRPSSRFKGAKKAYRLSKINRLLREARTKRIEQSELLSNTLKNIVEIGPFTSSSDLVKIAKHALVSLEK
jgi:hypothetical protein